MNKILFILLACLSGQLIAQTTWLDKGVQSFQNENYEYALKSFNKASKKDNSLELKFWVASCHFKLKDFSTAKDHFLVILNTTKLERLIFKSFLS